MLIIVLDQDPWFGTPRPKYFRTFSFNIFQKRCNKVKNYKIQGYCIHNTLSQIARIQYWLRWDVIGMSYIVNRAVTVPYMRTSPSYKQRLQVYIVEWMEECHIGSTSEITVGKNEKDKIKALNSNQLKKKIAIAESEKEEGAYRRHSHRLGYIPLCWCQGGGLRAVLAGIALSSCTTSNSM